MLPVPPVQVQAERRQRREDHREEQRLGPREGAEQDEGGADAALMSRAVGRPVRVQWSREDEHGWDPKSPPHLLEVRGAVNERGEVVGWHSEAWLPAPTQGLPNVPLLAPDAAGIPQPAGNSAGLIQQNQQEPQPRERDYFYGGAYYVWALWIGLGVFAILDLLRPLGLKELVRTGAVVMARGSGSIEEAIKR